MQKESTDYQSENNLKKDIREYIEKRVQLFVIEVTDQVSLVIANSFQKLLGMFLLGGALFFVLFAIAFYLGELIGNFSAGFALVSLPLIFIGIFFFRKRSKKFTENIQAELIGKVLENFESKKESK